MSVYVCVWVRALISASSLCAFDPKQVLMAAGSPERQEHLFQSGGNQLHKHEVR